MPVEVVSLTGRICITFCPMERIQSPNILRSVKSPMPQLFCVLRANTGTAVPEKRGLPRWKDAWEYSTDQV